MRLSQLRTRIPNPAKLLWPLMFLLLSAGASLSDDTMSMSGEWQSFWRNGQALLILNQQGDEVTGTYEPNRGKIEGRFEGRILKGRWGHCQRKILNT